MAPRHAPSSTPTAPAPRRAIMTGAARIDARLWHRLKVLLAKQDRSVQDWLTQQVEQYLRQHTRCQQT